METLNDELQSDKRRKWQTWQLAYGIVLVSILSISFVFQAGNIGWLLIVLGILYLFGFALHFGTWLMTILLSKKNTRASTSSLA